MVLFENDFFLVIDKRPGWLSIPGRQGKSDPTPCEHLYWEKDRKTKLWVVHRLDREVSGVMLFGKSDEAHRAASLWFERHQVTKRYEALAERPADPVANEPPAGEQRWESKLLRGKKRAYEKPFGKSSVTLASFQGPYDYSGLALELWQLSPLTGRNHQLRYEMMKHHRVVWGDELYGSQKTFPIEGAIGLRAVVLSLATIPDRVRWQLPAQIETTSLTRWLCARC